MRCSKCGADNRATGKSAERTPGFAGFAETFSGRLKRACFADVQVDNSRYFFRGRRWAY
jgi:hypothetical protein